MLVRNAAALANESRGRPTMATNRSKRVLAALLCLLWPLAAGAGEPEWQALMALGDAASNQQDFALARRNYQAALAEAEAFGPQDARLGRTLNRLATAGTALGDSARAEPLLRRALGIWQAAPAGNDLELATTLHHLAGIAYGKGDGEAAMSALKQALALREKALPAGHPALLGTRRSLATLEAGADAPAEPAPAATTAGGFALHLASLKTVAGAESEWRRLQQAFPKLLGKLKLSLEAVDLGDRGLYQRILSGRFAERKAARKVCATLKAKQQYCQVVRRRGG